MELRAQSRSRQLFWLALAILLVLAFRALLAFSPEDSLVRETEEFLFLRTSTSPPIAIALAVWLLVRRREALRRAAQGPPAPLLGAVLLGLGGLAFAWATCVDVAELLVFSLILTGFGAVALSWGRAALRPLLVPALVLLFVVPVPAPLYNRLVFPLQLVTAQFSAWLLKPLGIPAFVAADRIVLAQKSFQVIEGCSGFRSIQTLTLVAILYADLFTRNRIRTAILIGVAPPLAFLLNGVRILTMMLNPYSEIVSVHVIQGVVVLLGGLGVIHALDHLLGRWLPEPPLPPQGPAAGERSLLAALSVPRAAVLGVVGAALFAASLWLPRWDAAGSRDIALSSVLPADRVGEFHAVPAPPNREAPFFGKVGVSQAFRRRYQNGDAFVDVFVGYWDRARPDVSPFSPKTGYPGSGWVVEAEGDAPIQLDSLRIGERQLRRWTSRRLVYYWSEGEESLWKESLRSLLAWDRIAGHESNRAFVVRVATNLGTDEADRAAAEARLRTFADTVRAGLKPLERASG